MSLDPCHNASCRLIRLKYNVNKLKVLAEKQLNQKCDETELSSVKLRCNNVWLSSVISTMSFRTSEILKINSRRFSEDHKQNKNLSRNA